MPAIAIRPTVTDKDKSSATAGLPTSEAIESVVVVPPLQLEERLTEALRPLIAPDQVQTVLSSVSIAIRDVVQQSSLYRGPLPPPEFFSKYDSVVPGAADRILAMAEKEQGHRHSWEMRHLLWDGITSVLGLVFGWLLSLALTAGAVYCAVIGQAFVAAVLTGFAAFGAVASLIRGRQLFGKADHEVAKIPSNSPPKSKPTNKRR